MEIVGLIFSAENVRMLVLLAFGFCGYTLLKTSLEKKIDKLDHKIDGVEGSLNAKIDGVESSLNAKIDRVEQSLLKAMDEKIAAANQSLYAQLKTNDFTHLNNTIEALTFTLEKNGYLKREDKEYIDRRLDR